MNVISKSLLAFGIIAGALGLQSCNDDNNNADANRYSALVTVCPQTDGSFTLQLDNTTTLIPTNIKESPYKNKEVRALVDYTENTEAENTPNLRHVHINYMDSIRTKMPLSFSSIEDPGTLANDPIDIISDWVTIAEDGYLTLRLRTRWGSQYAKHYVDLITDIDSSDPSQMLLVHNANGDLYGDFGDSLVAFNLRDFLKPGEDEVEFTLKWHSFSGYQTTTFKLKLNDRFTPGAQAFGLMQVN